MSGTLNAFQAVGSELNAQTYGAKGNGTDDDTVALQKWLDAMAAANSPGYLPPGYYKTTAQLNGNGSANLSIRGGGAAVASMIALFSPTQNGLVVTGNGRISLRDFTVVTDSGVTPTAGASILFPGPRNSLGSSVIDNVSIFNAFNGIAGTAMTGNLTRLCLSASSHCIQLTDFGDSTIDGCWFGPLTGAVGIELDGDPGGARIINNKLNGNDTNGRFRWAIVCKVDTTDGDIFIIGNSIEAEHDYAIVVYRSGTTQTFTSINVIGNQIATYGHGISIASFDSQQWLRLVNVTSNFVQMLGSNGNTAIWLGNINGICCANNQIYGSPGTGISAASGARGIVHDNIIIGQSSPLSLPGSINQHNNLIM